ncbi:endothelin-converting enzyme homolog [Schistocerca nitens]|uniref:endothelin-converting enzyme homolog n=1 Tax=Schistocerca nitens TaxID=7011 RepID=UPI0021181F10|nr:endothelin-converting enzyme homolog [Schistocerca nitens]
MEDDSEKGLANGGRDSSPPAPSSPGEKAPCLPPSSSDQMRRSSDADSVGVKRGGRGRSGFVSRLQHSASKRTGLSRTGLIVAIIIILLCLALFIAVIVMAASWPVTPHNLSAPLCRTAACLTASAQVVSAMGSSDQSACDDMLKFSCGSWLRDNSIPASRNTWSQTEQLLSKYNEVARSLIVKLPQPNKIESIAWKMKNLYESCMELDSIEADGDRPLLRIINELGGWHVLRDFSVQSFDYKKTLIKLHKKYGVSPFFRVSVVPDNRNPERNVIQITPIELGLPDPSYYYRVAENAVAMAYQQFLTDVVQLLGATSTDARSFSSNMYHFEKRIAELLNVSEVPANPNEAYNRLTIDKLRQTAPSIPLQDILQGLFPRARISDKTEIIVTAPSYLNKVSMLLSTTDRSSLNDYMLWKLTVMYLPYLSNSFRSVYNNYNIQLTGVQEPVERWEMCVETVEKFMSFGLATMVENTFHEDERELEKTEVSKMFDSIRAIVRNSLLGASWYGSELKRLAVEKVNAMALAVGFPTSVTTDSFLEEYYSSFRVQKRDFFLNVQFGIEFLLSKQMELLVSPSEEQRWLEIMASSADVTYIPTENKIVIPQRRLMEPYFSAAYPKSVLYGRLGVQVSRGIVWGVISPWGALHTAGGSLLLPYNPEVDQLVQAVADPVACVMKVSAQVAGADDMLANRTALTTTIEVSAVRSAFKALTEITSKDPHIHQPALEDYESEQLFFVSYAQSTCSHSTIQQMDIDNTVSRRLNSSQLIPVVLKQLPEFSAVFCCPKESTHYASQPCHDIL